MHTHTHTLPSFTHPHCFLLEHCNQWPPLNLHALFPHLSHHIWNFILAHCECVCVSMQQAVVQSYCKKQSQKVCARIREALV